VGSYAPRPSTGNVLAYERKAGRSRVLVALNFGAREERVQLDSTVRVLLSTRLDRAGEILNAEATLRADEGLVMEFTPAAAAL
jgi:alpha-glucosidase